MFLFFFSRQLDFFFFEGFYLKFLGSVFFLGCLCLGFWDFGSGTIPWVLRLFSFGSVFFGWIFYGSDPMEFITIKCNHHLGEDFWNFFLSHRWSKSKVEKKSMLHPGKFSYGTYKSPMNGKEHDLNHPPPWGHVPAVNLEGYNIRKLMHLIFLNQELKGCMKWDKILMLGRANGGKSWCLKWRISAGESGDFQVS